MSSTERATIILGLINLKEDIYCGRTNWTAEQRAGLTDLIRSALDAMGALEKPVRQLRGREWPKEVLKNNQDQSIQPIGYSHPVDKNGEGR